jgi:hypothetical protein
MTKIYFSGSLPRGQLSQAQLKNPDEMKTNSSPWTASMIGAAASNRNEACKGRASFLESA